MKAVLPVLLACCAVAGCGSGDDSNELLIEIADPSHDKVAITAPSSIGAGLVTIKLENAGNMLHDAQLVRIDGKHAPAELAQVLEAADSAPKPGWMHPMGGVAAVAPKGNGEVTQVLESGRYLIVDTQERARSIVNAYKGGMTELEVTGETDDQLPATPARIVATDGSFRTSGLKAGVNRVTFENRGKELHQAVFLPIDESLPRALRADQMRFDVFDVGWVPVDKPHTSATAVLDSGGKLVTDMVLRPGLFGVVCFVSDRAGGGPHVQEDKLVRVRIPPG